MSFSVKTAGWSTLAIYPQSVASVPFRHPRFDRIHGRCYKRGRQVDVMTAVIPNEGDEE
jgi:hypothetical protein